MASTRAEEVITPKLYPWTAWAVSARKARGPMPAVGGWAFAAAFKTGKTLAALPFDALRFSYARAVKAGLVEKSMLASRDFENAVSALERMTLGPLARRV